MSAISDPIHKLPNPPVAGDLDFDDKADVFLPALVIFSEELEVFRQAVNSASGQLVTYVGTFVDGTTFTIPIDAKSWAMVGGRIKADCGGNGIKYATITSITVVNSVTTVVVSGDILMNPISSVRFFNMDVNTTPNHKSLHATGARDAIAPTDIGAAPTSHASTGTGYGAASETNYGHVQLGTATPAALGTAAKGTGTRAAKEDHVHPTTGVMTTSHAANPITGFGTEPGAVSSSTSGAAGTATTVSRSDHSHDLGQHTHVDAATGGCLLGITEPPAVSTSTSGAIGTATLLARADHCHDLGAHAHTGATVGGQLDHGAALTGLGDDDHTQYSLANGTRAFTAAVSGVTPTADAHLATKAYVDGIIAVQDAMVYKGVLDCSANPNFPAANRGHTYKSSVAGKIGGASGTNVEVGDMLICSADGSAAGDLATVGENWSVIQTNIDGAVVGPASATSGRIATFSGTTGKLIADGGILATNLVRKDAASIIADSIKLYFGTGSDLALYHDGTNSYIDNITGSLYIRPVASETGILIAPNGAVSLYYDNAVKLATSSAGVTVTGTMAATTVTGANVTSGADPGHMHTAYVEKSLLTAVGDIIYASAAGTPARLGVGSEGQALKVVSGVPGWGDVAASGGSEVPGVFARDTRFAAKTVSVAADRYCLLSPNRMLVDVNGLPVSLSAQQSLDLFQSATWDSVTTDYRVAANRAGKDFYVYAVLVGGVALGLLVSANATYPTGYSAATSRKLGGFHCLCLSVGTISGHTLSGYVTGDILPASVWDLKHRPVSAPEGMVYVAGVGKWVDIYLASVSAGALTSAYNATCADGASATVFDWYDFSEWLGRIAKRLPTQPEFMAAAAGSNEGTNIAGSADPGTTGGKTDTAGRRMISHAGVEDCCGNIWQWGIEAGAVAGTAAWKDQFVAGRTTERGQGWQEPTRALLGGYWIGAPRCGSRCSSWSDGPLTLHPAYGARGVADVIEEI